MTEKDKVEIGPEDLITVFLGKGLEPHTDYEAHPQIQWVSAKNGVPTQEVVGAISVKSKVFLFTEGMAASTYQALSTLARKDQIPYLHRRSDRAILGTLREYFPKGAQEQSPGVDQRGKLKRFFDAHPPDLKKGSAEEARRLQSVAREIGLVTTFASLAQAISQLKRKGGFGDRPASATPVSKNAAARQTIDDAIAGLQLMRDWVVSSEQEINELRAQLDGIRKAMKL